MAFLPCDLILLCVILSSNRHLCLNGLMKTWIHNTYYGLWSFDDSFFVKALSLNHSTNRRPSPSNTFRCRNICTLTVLELIVLIFCCCWWWLLVFGSFVVVVIVVCVIFFLIFVSFGF